MAYTMKTYNDSYLYKVKVLSTQKTNPSAKANAAIKDFIINSHRIEAKNSDAFRGVVEDVKRSQRSSCLYSILMMDDVKLCINDSEMPRAFKVFDAKDPKNDMHPTVFIDVTGLIEFKNGYYSCRRIDVLLAYLFDAMIYKLYRYAPNKILDNSTITMAATQAYVSMFCYIIDFKRVVGFSTNKNKISYLAALFFLTNMMGKSLNDNYVKTIAAKVADIPQSDIRAYDLYTNDNDSTFDNIAEFIKYISLAFNLKGFDIQVFISTWIQRYGTGTEYGCELYTSFLCLLANAYSGAYIVNQKQIDTACKSYEIKICLELEKVGNTAYNRGFMEGYENEIHSKNAMELAEAVNMRDEASKVFHIEESDFHIANAARDIAKNGIKFCNEARLSQDKANKFATNVIMTGINSAFKSSTDAITNEEFQYYELGSLTEAAKVLSGNFDNKQRYDITTTLNNDIAKLREMVRESTCEDKQYAQSVSKVISEMILVQQYI